MSFKNSHPWTPTACRLVNEWCIYVYPCTPWPSIFCFFFFLDAEQKILLSLTCRLGCILFMLYCWRDTSERNLQKWINIVFQVKRDKNASEYLAWVKWLNLKKWSSKKDNKICNVTHKVGSAKGTKNGVNMDKIRNLIRKDRRLNTSLVEEKGISIGKKVSDSWEWERFPHKIVIDME